MTENEEKNKEMSNPLPHILEFIKIRIRWGILDVPRKIGRWFRSLGWKITFSLMNSSAKKSLESLESVKKVFKFRDWMFERIIRYMTGEVGWVLTVTHPRAEHLKKEWVSMGFVNPKFLDVTVLEKEDGEKVVQSLGLRPHRDYLETEWHIMGNKHLEHILGQTPLKEEEYLIDEVEE